MIISKNLIYNIEKNSGTEKRGQGVGVGVGGGFSKGGGKDKQISPKQEGNRGKNTRISFFSAKYQGN